MAIRGLHNLDKGGGVDRKKELEQTEEPKKKGFLNAIFGKKEEKQQLDAPIEGLHVEKTQETPPPVVEETPVETPEVQAEVKTEEPKAQEPAAEVKPDGKHVVNDKEGRQTSEYYKDGKLTERNCFGENGKAVTERYDAEGNLTKKYEVMDDGKLKITDYTSGEPKETVQNPVNGKVVVKDSQGKDASEIYKDGKLERKNYTNEAGNAVTDVYGPDGKTVVKKFEKDGNTLNITTIGADGKEIKTTKDLTQPEVKKDVKAPPAGGDTPPATNTSAGDVKTRPMPEKPSTIFEGPLTAADKKNPTFIGRYYTKDKKFVESEVYRVSGSVCERRYQDEDGNRTKTVRYDASTGKTLYTLEKYDVKTGKPTEMKQYNADGKTVKSIYNYEFDSTTGKNNKTTEKTDNGTPTAQYKFNDKGQKTEQVWLTSDGEKVHLENTNTTQKVTRSR